MGTQTAPNPDDVIATVPAGKMATAGSWGREPLLDGDELLDDIEPIYIRSSELRQYRQVYDVEDEDLSSGDELADEQVNLDLTAPPSES